MCLQFRMGEDRYESQNQ